VSIQRETVDRPHVVERCKHFKSGMTFEKAGESKSSLQDFSALISTGNAAGD
jgi:hypothetical protein